MHPQLHLDSSGSRGLHLLTQAKVTSFGQKSETEPLWFGFGCTVGNSSWDQWGEMVGWCVRGSSNSGVQNLLIQAGAAGEVSVQNGAKIFRLGPGCRWGCGVL